MAVEEHRVKTTNGIRVLFGQVATGTLNLKVLNSCDFQNICAYVYGCLHATICAYKALYKMEFQLFLRQASPC